MAWAQMEHRACDHRRHNKLGEATSQGTQTVGELWSQPWLTVERQEGMKASQMARVHSPVQDKACMLRYELTTNLETAALMETRSMGFIP